MKPRISRPLETMRGYLQNRADKDQPVTPGMAEHMAEMLGQIIDRVQELEVFEEKHLAASQTSAGGATS